MQTVFIKIHSNIETLQNKDKVRAWMYQIARNTIFDFYREEFKLQAVADSGAAFEKNIQEEADEVLSRGIRMLIGLLPEKYSQALYLTEYDGLPQREVAQKLGVSIPGAKSRIQRARLMLKEYVLEFCHIEFDRYGSVIDYYPKLCPRCGKRKN
jgi:RNA polymerase sigma-70 factor (ECF subfamily)